MSQVFMPQPPTATLATHLSGWREAVDTIAHRDLRNSSSAILARVAAGETIHVTNHGKVAAVLVPPKTSSVDLLVSSGQIKLPTDNDGDFMGIPRVPGNTADILDDLRGD